MPQPTGSDLHIDTLLSNLSIAYMNEPSSYIADVVFPVVYTDKQSDKYAVYEIDYWFRDEAEKRAPLTESAGGGFALATPGTFYCDEWSFHDDIPEEDIWNADEVFNLEDDSTAYVVEKLRLRRENDFADTYFKEGVWTTDLKGQTDTPGAGEFLCWDQANSTPIDDIEDAKAVMRSLTGLAPNTLLVAERVHMALKNHSTVLDRYKYTQAGIITEALLAKVFELDRYFVGKAVHATNKEGDAAALAYILNQYGALLLYVNPRPSKRKPSAGYTFRWNRPRIAGREGEKLESVIRRIELKKQRGTRIEGSMWEDQKLVAAGCGIFFKDAIAAGRTIES